MTFEIGIPQVILGIGLLAIAIIVIRGLWADKVSTGTSQTLKLDVFNIYQISEPTTLTAEGPVYFILSNPEYELYGSRPVEATPGSRHPLRFVLAPVTIPAGKLWIEVGYGMSATFTAEKQFTITTRLFPMHRENFAACVVLLALAGWLMIGLLLPNLLGIYDQLSRLPTP